MRFTGTVGAFDVGCATDADTDDSSTRPEAFALLQNHPNPFNQTTVIPFTVRKTESVRLVLYDVRGGMIRQLIDDVRHAGSHQAIWDGRDARGREVASGVYFYLLEAGGFRKIRSMVLIK